MTLPPTNVPGGNDIFTDPVAVSADLELQEILLWSRSELAERLIAASLSQAADVQEALRIETMYQVCEFFYLLRARGIVAVEQIERLADIHNLHIEQLTADPAKMRRLGLRKERLLEAIFTGDTKPRLLDIWRARPGWIDQSNLARFLATVMSTETCRKLVLAAAEAGFLSRTRSPYGAMLVYSTGVMEHVFGLLLRETRLRIIAAGDRTPPGEPEESPV